MSWIARIILTAACTQAVLADVPRVGMATADITPPIGYRMSGYFSERFSTGIHDPLQAKALVLQQGRERVALVFCDILYVSLEVSNGARREAARRTGIPASNVMITATHAHTGPLYFGPLRDWFHQQAIAERGKDSHESLDYGTWLAGQIADVIERAADTVRPATLGVSVTSETRLSFNRRFHMKDGGVRFNPGQQNPNIVKAAGPIDPDVGILLVRDAQSQDALSVLTVFALHTDTTGGTEYSADYPFYLERELKRTLGHDLISLFGLGTCGDINHIDVRIKGRRSAEEIGTMLAETVRDALRSSQPVDPVMLAVRREVVSVPMQKFSPEEAEQARADLAKVGTRDLPFLEQVKAYKIADIDRRGGESIPMEVQVMRLGPDVAIVGLPGEVFVEVGLAIKKASPFEYTMVIELANAGPGYVPTRKAFAEGSYETVNTRIVPSGGERLIETASRLLNVLSPE